MDHCVQLPQNLAEFGVEVILYAVVTPEWGMGYLPGIWAEMRDHLFPTSLCSYTKRCYSAGVHSTLSPSAQMWFS